MTDRKISPSVASTTEPEYHEEFQEEAPYVVPPDGGWGWVVVAASFFCNMIVDGIIFSFGTFLPDLSAQFNATKSQVSWIGSLLSGFYLMSGPFVSAMANRWDFRTVTIAGAVISCFAFILSYFATSISYLYITYGIIGGIGFGMIYMPAVISASFYFEKKRALATGIAVCGSGIGTFLMAPFCTYLMETFSWQGSFLIQAGLALNCAVFGALFRPVEPKTVVVQNLPEIKIEAPTAEETGTPLLQRIKKAREADKCTWVSTDSFMECSQFIKGSTSELTGSTNRFLRNGGVPVDMQQRRKSAADVDHMKLHPYVKRQSEPFIHGRVRGSSVAKAIMERRRSSLRPRLPSLITEDYHHSADPMTHSEKDSDIQIQIPKQRRHSSNLQSSFRESELDDVAEASENSSSNKDPQEGPVTLSSEETVSCSRASNVMDTNENLACKNGRKSDCSLKVEDEYRRLKKLGQKEAMRPFYRDDIFYSSSVTKLPQYKSASSVDHYHASVTQLPTYVASQILNPYNPLYDRPIEEEAVCCPASCTIVINNLMDFKLMKSPTFIVLAFAGFLTMVGFFIPFMYLADRALLMGFSKESAALLLSIIGITNTAGRMVCGIVADKTNIPALQLHNVALVIGGVATGLAPHLLSYTALIIYCLVFAFSIACFASLRAIIVVDLLGLEKLNNAFGLLLFFQGVAATIGSPLVGVFYDLTQNYNITFYIAGFMLGMSGLMLIPLPILNRWEKARDERRRAP